jgi:hypothetical protein
MAQTQRRPVPLNDSGELDTALAFLNFKRESVPKKADGLDSAGARVPWPRVSQRQELKADRALS